LIFFGENKECFKNNSSNYNIIMNEIIISTLLSLIISFIFLASSLRNYFKKKSNPSFLMFLIILGIFFAYFFGYIRSFFFDNPLIDSFFWRLSGIFTGVSFSSFIMLSLIWTYFKEKNRQKIIKIIAIIYFIGFALSFLIPEPLRVESAQGYTDWVPFIFTQIFIYLGVIATIVSLCISIFFGIKNKKLKPIIFGIGVLLTLLGLLLDGIGLVDYLIFYRIIAMIGVSLMFYSSIMKG